MRLILLSLSATLLVATIVNAQEPASRALTPAEFNAIVSWQNGLNHPLICLRVHVLFVLMRCASPSPLF